LRYKRRAKNATVAGSIVKPSGNLQTIQPFAIVVIKRFSLV